MVKENLKGIDVMRDKEGKRYDLSGRRLYFFELISNLGYSVSYSRPCVDGSPIKDYRGDIDQTTQVYAG